MKRQNILLLRLVLAYFSLFSIGLPLDHTCFGTVPPDIASFSGSGNPKSTAEGWYLSSARPDEGPGLSSPRNDPGRACFACLWAHSLFYDGSIDRSGIIQVLSSEPVSLESPGTALSSIRKAITERGPPHYAVA